MKIIKKEILGLVLMLISLLSFFSIVFYDTSEHPSGVDESLVEDTLGWFGIYAGYYQYVFLGYFSVFISFILSVIGYALFSNKPIAKFYKLIIYLFVFSLWLSTLFSLFGYNHLSGIVGFSIFTFLNDIFGSFGSAAIMLILFISLLILIFQISIYDNTSNLGSFLFKKIKILYNSILSFSKNKIKFKKHITIDKKEEDNIEELNTPTINVAGEFDSEKTIDDSKEFDEESDDLKIEEEPIDKDNEINNSDNDEESILIEDEIDIERGDYDAKIAVINYQIQVFLMML